MRCAPIALLVLLGAASCAARERALAGSPLEAAVLAPGWSQELDFGGPLELRAAGAGFVVFGAAGEVAFFDGATGTVRWRISLGGALSGPPAVAPPGPGEEAWAAAPLEGGVALLALRDGRIRSLWPRPEGERLALSAAGDALVVVTDRGRVLALDPASGAERWSADLPAPPAGPPATPCGGQLLVGLQDGRMAGLDGRDGSARWTKHLHSPAAVAPGCADGHFLVATQDDTLHALRLHRRSAGRMWMVRSGADPAAPPLDIDKTVLFLSKDTYLYGFRRRNGHLVFRIRLGRRPGPAALLEDLVLVAGLHSTRLDAYRLPAGLNAGGFDLPEGTRFVTPPVAAGDRVAFGVARFGETDRARLIALSLHRSGTEPAAGP